MKKFLLFSLSLIMCMTMISFKDVHASTIKEKTIDISSMVLQSGGYLPMNSDEVTLQSNSTKFIKKLNKEAKKWNKKFFNVSKYKIKYSKLSAIFTRFYNSHPELFYLKPEVKFTYYTGNRRVQKIRLIYNKRYNKSHVNKFNTKVKSIVSGVNMKWPSERRALYLHDYIVRNCQYDLNYKYYDAYACLITRKAVCQGYSLAYSYLLDKVGIGNDVVSSVKLDHAWNSVKIGSKYYFVDCTWDDALWDTKKHRYNLSCMHNNFLINTSKMKTTGHYYKDWVNTSGKNVYNKYTDSKYNNYYWKDANTAITFIGNRAYYTEQDSYDILDVKYHDYSTNKNDTACSIYIGQWENYASSFSTMAASGNYLYITGPKNVYKYDTKTNTYTTCYSLSNSLNTNYGLIYGIRKSGNSMILELQKKPYNSYLKTTSFKMLSSISLANTNVVMN